jgi:hypothetical protein
MRARQAVLSHGHSSFHIQSDLLPAPRVTAAEPTVCKTCGVGLGSRGPQHVMGPWTTAPASADRSMGPIGVFLMCEDFDVVGCC